LTLLVSAFTAGKLIVDKFTKSTKELVGKFDAEIDGLRKLQILMTDSNRTDEEKIRILADYAKDYPVLLGLLDNEKIAIESVLKLLKTEIKVREDGKKAAMEQRLEQLKLRLEIQKAEKAAFEESQKKTIGGKIGKFLGVKRLIDPKLEEEIKRLDALLNPERFKITRAEPTFEWSLDMKKALDKLRYEQSSAKEQAHADLIESLAEFGMTEEKKTDLTIGQLEARERLYKAYNEDIKEIDKEAIANAIKIAKIAEKAAKKAATGMAMISGHRAEALRKPGVYPISEDEWERRFGGKKDEKPIDPSDYARGMIDGLKEVGKELKNEYKTWKDLTTNVAHSMSDTLSDVFFDSMTGQLRSAEDYWQAFTTSVKRMIADMASKWVMLQAFGGAAKGIDWIGTALSVASLGGGGGGGGTSPSVGGGPSGVGPIGSGLMDAHSGGLIKMHDGGMNLKSDETLRILKNKEYVIKDSSTRSIGVAALNQANRTGRLPQAQPQTVVHKYYNYVYAIDSESMDVALRKRGAGAISDISLNANAYARSKRDPRAGRRY